MLEGLASRGTKRTSGNEYSPKLSWLQRISLKSLELSLKGPYPNKLSFYMFKHSFCWHQRHACWPNLISDFPTIKQKLKFLALVRHVKVAIRNNKWHAKLAIRNNKWHAKLAIRNNILDSLFCMPLIVPDSHFYVPLIVPDSQFCVPIVVPDSHFYMPY